MWWIGGFEVRLTAGLWGHFNTRSSSPLKRTPYRSVMCFTDSKTQGEKHTNGLDGMAGDPLINIIIIIIIIIIRVL